jgi:hypothetical protein
MHVWTLIPFVCFLCLGVYAAVTKNKKSLSCGMIRHPAASNLSLIVFTSLPFYVGTYIFLLNMISHL